MSSPKIRGALKRTLIWIILLSMWEGAYRNPHTHWRSFIFPAPTQVLDSMLGMVGISTGFGEDIHPGWPRALDEDVSPPPLLKRVVFSPLVVGNLVSAVRLVAGFSLSII